MPLFFDEWDLILGPMLGAVLAEHADGGRAQTEARRATRRQEDQLHLERGRWLEEHRAERSFLCGFLPSPSEVATGDRPLNVAPSEVRFTQVTAAVLPDDVAFLREEADDLVELGRIPRTAIREVDVVDQSGVHVPEPLHETFEPPALSLLVLRWENAGADDEDRFAFRSPWMAWQAAHRLRAAAPV